MVKETIQAKSTADVKVAPGPRGKFLLGSLTQMQSKGTLLFYVDAWREFGDVSRFNLLRLHKFSLIPDGLDYFAAHPFEALAAIGC